MTVAWKKFFFKLKVIKTYLRASIQQERQNTLAIISIDSEMCSLKLGQNAEELC